MLHKPRPSEIEDAAGVAHATAWCLQYASLREIHLQKTTHHLAKYGLSAEDLRQLLEQRWLTLGDLDRAGAVAVSRVLTPRAFASLQAALIAMCGMQFGLAFVFDGDIVND